MQISVTRNVAVRPPAVFSTVCNIAEWPTVIRSILSIELLTPGPLRVGTRASAQRVMFGRVTAEKLEVVEIERPRRLRLAATSRDLEYERDHIIDAIENGSRLTLIFRPKPSTEVGRAALPFITPFMEINLRDELEQDLADLVAAISAVPAKTGNVAHG
jgi:hypothetical protein